MLLLLGLYPAEHFFFREALDIVRAHGCCCAGFLSTLAEH